MLNRITIMGRLTRDPELRHTQSNLPVASFSLACERDLKSGGSDNREVDFIDCVAWRSTAEFVSKYLSKGRMAVVSGRLQLRDWTDREGNKRRSAEVIAESVYFCDSRKDDGGGNAGVYPGGENAASAKREPYRGNQGGYQKQGTYAGYGGGYGNPRFSELSDDDGDLSF